MTEKDKYRSIELDTTMPYKDVFKSAMNRSIRDSVLGLFLAECEKETMYAQTSIYDTERVVLWEDIVNIAKRMRGE